MKKYSFTFLIILVTTLLYSQEQVSDFTKHGVYKPTDVSSHLGFAEINGEHYMLQENDSLTISIWSGDKFTPLHIIPTFHCQALNEYPIQTNRSSLSIINGKYYRFLEQGIQVINIPTGAVEIEYISGGEERTWDFLRPVHISEDRIYFTERIDFESYSLALDLSTSEIDTFDLSFYNNSIIEDTYINRNTLYYSVQAINLKTGQDSTISNFTDRIQLASISSDGNSLLLVDALGDIWRITSDFSSVKTECNISAYPGLERIMINGSKLLAYYKDGEESHTIVVWDLNTGNEDLQFKADSQNFRRDFFDPVSNESLDERYSILGFYGFIDAAGNPAGGNYYLIDHQNNHFVLLPGVRRVRSYTPFLYEDNVYFSCFDTDSDQEYLARYDITNKEYVKLDVDADKGTSATLGYPIDDSIIAATNTKEETPQVWSISPQDSFTSIQNLDYLDNLGISFVSRIAPMDDRIYFCTNSGVFSTLHDTREEFGLENDALNQAIYADFRLSGYKDRVTFATFNGNNAVFTVIDTETGAIQDLEESGMRNSLYSVRGAGPFIFFKNQTSDHVQYLDNKTNEFDSLPGLTNVDPVRMTIGNEHVLLRDGRVSDDGSYNMYQVDYETNEIKNFVLDFTPDEVEIGTQDAYYFFHRVYDKDSIKVSIMDQNGNFSTIYRGIGRYGNGNELHAYDYENHDDARVTFFHLYDINYRAIILANDLEKTDVVDLREIERARIIANYKDRIILDGKDSLRQQRYFIYQAFNPVQEVQIPEDGYVSWVGIRNTESLFLYKLKGETYLLKHSHASNNSTTHKLGDFTAYVEYRDEGISINDTTYLLRMSVTNSTDGEVHPWILNTQSNTLQRSDQVYGGPEISSPDDLLRFKDWIYFTGEVKGLGRQWFRLGPPGPSNTSPTLELISESSELQIYPNPSISYFKIDSDFENLYVLNMKGQLVMEMEDYSSHQSIDISRLNEGSYLVIGHDKEGNKHQCQLVKLND